MTTIRPIARRAVLGACTGFAAAALVALGLLLSGGIPGKHDVAAFGGPSSGDPLTVQVAAR